MSTPSPAKVGLSVEEERGMGTTPVKVARGVVDQEERGTGTTPVKVVRRGEEEEEEEEEERGTGSTPVKVGRRTEEQRGTATTPVKVKAEAGCDGSLITIKVQSQTAADVFFRVKRDIKLKRVIDMYCHRQSLNPEAVAFLDPYGRTIQQADSDKTPEEAGLKDGDAIDVFLHQTGGTGVPLHASKGFA